MKNTNVNTNKSTATNTVSNGDFVRANSTPVIFMVDKDGMRLTAREMAAVMAGRR